MTMSTKRVYESNLSNTDPASLYSPTTRQDAQVTETETLLYDRVQINEDQW